MKWLAVVLCLAAERVAALQGSGPRQPVSVDSALLAHWAGLTLSVQSGPGTGPEATAEAGALDANGDGVLDQNIVVGRTEAVVGWLRSRTLELNNADLVQLGQFADEDAFEAAFGAGIDAVFWKVGTELNSLKDLQEQLLAGDEPASKSSVSDWFTVACKVDIGWVNFLHHKIELFWRDAAGELSRAGTVKPGERNTEWRNSYIGHEFVLRHDNLSDSDGDGGSGSGSAVEESFRVETDEFHRFGNFGSKVGDRKRPSPEQYQAQKEMEWNKVPRIKKNFTKVGFQPARTPPALMADIMRYYHVNWERAFRENWGSGFYVNWWDKDVELVPPPFPLARKWHALFMGPLAEWSGTPLEPTDLYGIRTYYTGAELADHVDREATHAVSAIVNVAQHDMKSDWQLEIYDMEGKEHHLPMKPGDAMYYESARCMHGRPAPLDGAYYTNIFFHYRPQGGNPNWFDDQSVDDEKQEL